MNRIKKGDKVKVLTGKDAGKVGEVIAVYPKQNKVLVNDINIIKRHTKPTQQSKGGIIEKPAPIAESNVMLVDGNSDTPTRVRFSKNKDIKVRESVKTGKTIKA